MIKSHKYRDLSPEQIEEVLSHYLFDAWSYSKVSSFARNEKAFEMQYVYNIPYKNSASTVAGSAYHKALEAYFKEKQKGIDLQITDLQEIAFTYIDEMEPMKWKLQKTTPTIEECKIAATKAVNSLLENFFNDIHVYISELQSVLYIETYIDEFLVINGVEIPLPCHAIIDLVIKTTDNKIVLIDHKSKSAYTDEKDIKFSIGKQAITYVNAFEANTDLTVDEVWFVENKISKNRDGSPQLICNKVVIDKDTRMLYEALLYEPLKRMLEAISNPDYVYLINENDNFVDKAEIYEFWAQTMIAEVSDYNIPANKKEMIDRRLKKIRDVSISTVDPKIIKKFRENASQFIQYDLTNKDMTKEQKIEHTLRTLDIIVNIEHTFSGYSSDTFLLNMSAGINLSSIFRYQLDIANALSVPNVRIAKDLHVFQGKSYIAIEASKVREKTLLFDPGQLEGVKIPLGFDNFGNKIVWDTSNPSTPHVLVGGSTGCLAAGTRISCHVPHYKNRTKSKTIKALFKIQNGEPGWSTKDENKNKNKNDILIRCLDESTNTFTYTPFEVVYSGKKQCYKMLTDAGQKIECTTDHRFLTVMGWKKLSELNVGDCIMYRPPVRKFKGKSKQQPLKDVFVKYHPKGRTRIVVDATSRVPYTYYRIPFHHFVYEADKNGLSFYDYKKLLNNYDGRELYFIPKGYEVDHIDGNRKNNDPKNLQMLTKSEHAIKTLNTANGVFGHFRPNECVIISITPTKIQDTYDICCKSNNHNFVANNLIVHNSGKSVCLISIIEYAKLAGFENIEIFDPKHEFLSFRGNNVSVYNDIEEIETVMETLVEEMNMLVKTGKTKKTLIVFDEFADAVANSAKGNDLKTYETVIVGNYANGAVKTKRVVSEVKKSLEENLRILLQKGRSSGYRIVAATQRASVKVITGDAKVNFPVQICFKVPKEVDSKVILDESGAESLAGMGDGLIKSPQYPGIIRFQSFYKP